MHRRRFLGLAALAGTSPWRTQAAHADAPGVAMPARGADALARLEAASGGRLGVALRDGDGRLLGGWRSGERFPMCSTFKALLAGKVLADVDAGRLRLERAIPVRAEDKVAYAPVVEAHIGGTITLAELCEAAIVLSDNMAANLMLARIGGPAGLTDWLRAIGDRDTRLDRTEPSLNAAIPDDPRDTTTPAAMTSTWRAMLFDEVLSQASRARLQDWLHGCRTGDARIRAGVPAGWTVGDKTGSGEHATTNDVAVLHTPDGRTLLLAVYLTGAEALPAAGRDGTIAAVARVMVGLAMTPA